MDNPDFEPVSVFRFVLAFVGVKLAAGAGLVIYTLTELVPTPPIFSMLATVAAVGLAMAWYAREVNRPMSGSELLKFSIGTALADIAMSNPLLIAMLLLGGGIPFSQGWVRAVLGEDPLSALTDLIIHLGPGWIKVFSLSAFLAWLMSRRLPKRNRIGEGFE